MKQPVYCSHEAILLTVVDPGLSREVAPTYYLTNFSWKLHENEKKNGPGRGTSLVPPKSATVLCNNHCRPVNRKVRPVWIIKTKLIEWRQTSLFQVIVVTLQWNEKRDLRDRSDFVTIFMLIKMGSIDNNENASFCICRQGWTIKFATRFWRHKNLCCKPFLSNWSVRWPVQSDQYNSSNTWKSVTTQ